MPSETASLVSEVTDVPNRSNVSSIYPFQPLSLHPLPNTDVQLFPTGFNPVGGTKVKYLFLNLLSFAFFSNIRTTEDSEGTQRAERNSRTNI